MASNLRLCLFVLALVLITAPAVPVLAEIGGEEKLMVGSRGSRVTELQLMLQKAGFLPAEQKVSGYYGWATLKAVVALERKYGLKADGQVGREEWNILYGQSKVVLGYYAVDYPGDRLSHNSLLNFGWLVNQVAMFDFFVDSGGNLKGSPSTEGIKLARKNGAGTLMVIHNISAGIHDPHSAQGALAVKSNRKNLIDNIVRQVDKYGYDGVNVDLEGLPPSSREDFNAFLEQLSSHLKPRSKLLILAVPAKTGDKGNNWSAAYDYRTIGRLADYVAIMAYDEHWGGGPPGPVASIPWVTGVLDYSVKVIPPHKILMGVACYGYDWPAGQKGKPVRWKDVPGLVGMYGSAGWDNSSSVPYLYYSKNGVKHQVWFENRYSLAIKLGLVEKYGLGGIAIWRLGYEDSSFWETLERHLN